ncbi:MAG: M20/M25/M40 family metallo-hydrolase [Proteobacteria bacterium]|nr:M20/M25/M40 family metallo-hydrolase [Pseudomonadota bacterium]
MQEVDRKAALGRLMRFLSVEGVTGQEKAIGQEIVAALKECGVADRAIRFDKAHKQIPLPTETGNLIVTLPGRGALRSSPRLMFMTHMDTVPICAGAKPRVKGRRIVNDAPTGLGGDNRAGCAVLATLVAELMSSKADHPPLTLVFTVREESGLWGARFVDHAMLGDPGMCFNLDGRYATGVTVGALGADRWEVEVHGRASHAGGAPEKGISAMMIVAEALAEVRKGGWFGKVIKGDRMGTSNVGPVMGADGGPAGQATNVVTDFVRVKGESRSHDTKFFKEITTAYKAAFESAVARVKNSEGKTGKVKFTSVTEYHPFRLKETAPVVKRAMAGVKAAGLEPSIRVANGGLDANWLSRNGIPTVTFGGGQIDAHTVDEQVDLDEFDNACKIAVTLATMV